MKYVMLIYQGTALERQAALCRPTAGPIRLTQEGQWHPSSTTWACA